MTERARDILLHPVRMRIFAEVTGGNATAKTIGMALPDVPQATLYRHINKLLEGGFLEVADEIPIRGTVERVFKIGKSGLSSNELAGMDADELRSTLNTILGGFISDIDRYLGSHHGGSVDPLAEGFEFSKAQIHLTDDEFRQVQKELRNLLEPLVHFRPSKDRRRRSFAYLFIPLEAS
jgi:DNA-binding transcriptional ArsR family regulator